MKRENSKDLSRSDDAASPSTVASHSAVIITTSPSTVSETTGASTVSGATSASTVSVKADETRGLAANAQNHDGLPVAAMNVREGMGDTVLQPIDPAYRDLSKRLEELRAQVEGMSDVHKVFAKNEQLTQALAAKEQELAARVHELQDQADQHQQVVAAKEQELAARVREFRDQADQHQQVVAAKEQELAARVRELKDQADQHQQVVAAKEQELLDQETEALVAKDRALEAQELAFKAEVIKTGMYAVENIDLLVKTGNFVFKKNGLDVAVPNVSNEVKGFTHLMLALKNYEYSGLTTSLFSTAVFNAKLFSNYVVPQWLQDNYQDVVKEYPYAKCIVDGGVSFASSAAIFSPQAALPYGLLTAASCAAEITHPGTGSYIDAFTSSLKIMFSGNVVTKAIDALAVVDALDAYEGLFDFGSAMVLSGGAYSASVVVADSAE